MKVVVRLLGVGLLGARARSDLLPRASLGHRLHATRPRARDERAATRRDRHHRGRELQSGRGLRIAIAAATFLGADALLASRASIAGPSPATCFTASATSCSSSPSSRPRSTASCAGACGRVGSASRSAPSRALLRHQRVQLSARRPLSLDVPRSRLARHSSACCSPIPTRLTHSSRATRKPRSGAHAIGSCASRTSPS